mmetsp:Transcript_3904/g.6925  ORF Transcript_3904/g.6925 Transcript_3904/m.6925 type:complete len:88 (+) Transcript_3904:1308-1571(+)
MHPHRPTDPRYKRNLRISSSGDLIRRDAGKQQEEQENSKSMTITQNIQPLEQLFNRYILSSYAPIQSITLGLVEFSNPYSLSKLMGD